jgi:hypothetical protein
MSKKPEFDVATFLSKVYGMTQTDEALDFIMDEMSNLLEGLDWKQFDDGMQELGGPRLFGDGQVGNPQFEAINGILKEADPWKMSDTVTLTFLVMTFKNKDRYSEYWPFIKKVKKRFLETGDRKRATALLRGYI